MTAVGEGEAVITAIVNDAKAVCRITVKESKVIPETENMVLDKGETAQLPVEIIGQSQIVKYVSTNHIHMCIQR